MGFARAAVEMSKPANPGRTTTPISEKTEISTMNFFLREHWPISPLIRGSNSGRMTMV
jgi:hypothetical protein